MNKFELPPNKPEIIYYPQEIFERAPNVVDSLDNILTTKALSKKFGIIKKRDMKLRWKGRRK